MKASKRIVAWDAVRQLSDRLMEIEKRIMVVEVSPVLSMSEEHRQEVQRLLNEKKLLRVAQDALMAMLC
jgi:major membrane immunogen (membrane-anchored lipoprotein)